MNRNVSIVIQKIKEENRGEIFLSLKPQIDNLETTIAHLYSYGGSICHFNMPEGDGYKKWNKEYEKYSYGKYEFVPARGFEFLFSNWNKLIMTCKNRAHDNDNFINGCVSGKKPVNHYERMRENIIAASNYSLEDDFIAVIDMEYSVDKKKLANSKINKNPKADLVCASVEGDRIIFYITEYKSTENGFGVSLQEHYRDMSAYYNNIKIKEHLIKTLQERVKYGLVDCSEKVISTIRNLTVNDIDVELLFMFSNSVDFEKSQRKNLKEEYSYIFEKSNIEGIPVKYLYINSIEKGCLKKDNLRGFELNGEFVFNNRIKNADLI